jgi:hypothetical protein
VFYRRYRIIIIIIIIMITMCMKDAIKRSVHEQPRIERSKRVTLVHVVDILSLVMIAMAQRVTTTTTMMKGTRSSFQYDHRLWTCHQLRYIVVAAVP